MVFFDKTALAVAAIFCCSVALAQPFAGGFHFEIPAATAAQPDFLPVFSALPIDESRRVTAGSDGNFHLPDGSTIRFWGATLGAAGAFPSKTDAPAIAARIRKMGINLVRFHHIDNTWAGEFFSLFDYLSGSTRQLNAERLDRLEFLIAELKKNGIYVDMNLCVARTYGPLDGVAAADSINFNYAKPMTLFDPFLRDLQKEYAEQLLRHVNPHTGLALADDPVLAMIELNNESSIYNAWRLDQLAAAGGLPDFYDRELDAFWRSWLYQKYGCDAALAAAWAVGAEAPPPLDQATDGGFESGKIEKNWRIELSDGALAAAFADDSQPFEGQFSAHLEVTQPTATDWHVQLNQTGGSLVAGRSYRLRFAARSDGPRQLAAALGQHCPPFGNYFWQNAATTAAWQVFEFDFTAPSSNAHDTRIQFIPEPVAGSHFWIDAVSLTEIPFVAPAPDPEEVVSNGDFEQPLGANWRTEDHAGAAPTMTLDAANPFEGQFSLRCEQPVPTAQTWHVQFKHVGGNLEKDSLYELRFAVRAAAPMNFQASVLRDSDPYTWQDGGVFPAATGWQTHALAFRATENNAGDVRVAFNLNGSAGTIWLDAVSLAPVRKRGLLKSESLDWGNVRRITFSERKAFTDARSRDLAEFYIGLEKGHFDEMRAFLRQNLLVKAPVTGSNNLYEPAEVLRQENMDFIDDHAYWDHPTFPNQPWDAWDWQIENRPMVKDPQFRAISQMFAGYAMASKPYTISEYNHGAPNRFRVEMAPAMAAYASFHSADAIMWFDYEDEWAWELDGIHRFFDLRGDHSVMSLFPSCALAYREKMIDEAAQPVVLDYGREWIYGRPSRTENRWENYHPNDIRHALVRSVRTGDFVAGDVAPDAASLPALPQNVFETEGGQTRLDVEKGILTTSSARFCSLTGFLGDAAGAETAYLKIIDGQDFGAVTWVSLDQKPLAETSKSLLTIASKQQQAGMIWDGATTVHDNWGGAPSEQFPLELRLEMRCDADTLLVWPLSGEGKKTGAALVRLPSAAGRFDVVFDQKIHPTLWFGIEPRRKTVAATLPFSPLFEAEILPNPTAASAFLRVRLPEKVESVEVEIFAADGRKMLFEAFGQRAAGDHFLNLDLKNLPAGAYSWRTRAGAATASGRLLRLED